MQLNEQMAPFYTAAKHTKHVKAVWQCGDAREIPNATAGKFFYEICIIKP